jgi:hypothetical protein
MNIKRTFHIDLFFLTCIVRALGSLRIFESYSRSMYKIITAVYITPGD